MIVRDVLVSVFDRWSGKMFFVFLFIVLCPTLKSLFSVRINSF